MCAGMQGEYNLYPVGFSYEISWFQENYKGVLLPKEAEFNT